LFVAGGVQTDFPIEKSPEHIDEMVVPKIPYYENIIVDYVVVCILVCSPLDITLHPESISLDHPTQTYIPYHHLHHRRHGYDFRYLQKRCERQNRRPILTTKIDYGWIDEWSWVHFTIFLMISYPFVSSAI
jgi:hypothetical protein